MDGWVRTRVLWTGSDRFATYATSSPRRQVSSFELRAQNCSLIFYFIAFWVYFWDKTGRQRDSNSRPLNKTSLNDLGSLLFFCTKICCFHCSVKNSNLAAATYLVWRHPFSCNPIGQRKSRDHVRNKIIVLARSNELVTNWVSSAKTRVVGREPWPSGYGRRKHVLKVVSSNPSTVYWMDVFSH